MKIVQICHNYLPHIGGIEYYIKRTVDNLVQKNYKSKVLTTDMNTPLNGRKDEATYFKTSISLMRNPFSMDFTKHLISNNYEIMHLHSIWFITSFMAVLFSKKAKIVTTIHGVYPNNPNRSLKFFLLMYKPFAKFVLTNSDVIIVLSNLEKNSLIKKFNISEKKVIIIHNGINVEPCIEKKEDSIILFTGRIIKEKNPELVISAVALLPPIYKHFKIIFIGSIENQYKTHLINYAQKIGIEDRLFFIAPLDPSIAAEKNKLMNYYKSARVFLSLGSWEGQPTRLMEAMQFKTPVIAYGSGGTEDFISDGINGVILKILDPVLLAEKLDSILRDRAYAAKLGKNGRRTIELQYSWENSFLKILKVYNDLIVE